MSKTRIFGKGVLLLALLLVCPAMFSQDVFEGVERIVAVGDVHGGFNELTGVLRSAGLIDNRNRWAGGKAHLVQTGDMVDRGADSRKVMDLLMELEKQADKSGGAVHVLIGNHESMNIYGDLRYVSREEYESYKGPNAAQLRDESYESLADPSQKNDSRYRRNWEEQHPLGWVEHRLAFSANGRYGKWLRGKNAVIKINNALFVHGGIGPKYISLSIREINEQVRAELKDFSKLKGGLVTDADGPLWYRALTDESQPGLAGHVDKILQTFGVRHIVIAHTPGPGAVMPHFGGKVIVVDVGLSEHYGNSPACLVFEGTRPFALHRGTKLEIPLDRDVLPYLKTAAALDPPNSILRNYINRLLRDPTIRPD